MSEHITEVTEATFGQEVKQQPGFVLVDFWASWCGPCAMVVPALETMAEKFQGKIKIAKVNIDDNHKIASDLGIMSIPTLVLFKDGNEIERIVGALGESELTKKVESHIG